MTELLDYHFEGSQKDNPKKRFDRFVIKFGKRNVAGFFLTLLLVIMLPLTVVVLQQRQNFHQRAAEPTQKVLLGTALRKDMLTDTNKAFLEKYGFKSITPENEMKMSTLQPLRDQFNFGPADQLVNYALSKGMQVRGHTLVWDNQIPSWLTNGVSNGTISKSDVKAILQKHIKTVVGHFKGKVVSWDVVNENLLTDSFWKDNLGEDFIKLSYQWAREADPQAKLYYNDYRNHDNNLLKIKQLKSQGVPIDGYGFQTHLGGIYGYSTGDLIGLMREYAALGMETAITEMDVQVGTNSPEYSQLTDQAKRYGDVARACYSATNCKSFTVWGMCDSYSWIKLDAPLLFDYSCTPKQAYTTVKTALQISASYSVPYTFRDVTPDYFGFSQLEQLVLKKTKAPDSTGISGCSLPDGTGKPAFCPENPVNRAEMAKFIITAKEDSVSTAQSVFTDMAGYEWAIKYAMRMKELGITAGCGNGTTYCPKDTVSRGTMVIFLSRSFPDFASFKPPTTPSFPDVSPTQGELFKAVEFVKAKNITQGTDGSKCGRPAGTIAFCPTNNVTRIEMSVFLLRAFPPLPTPTPTQIAPPAYSVSGRVTQQGTPKQGVIINYQILNQYDGIEDKTATTGPDGKYSIPVVYTNYAVWVTPPDGTVVTFPNDPWQPNPTSFGYYGSVGLFDCLATPQTQGVSCLEGSISGLNFELTPQQIQPSIPTTIQVTPTPTMIPIQ